VLNKSGYSIVVYGLGLGGKNQWLRIRVERIRVRGQA
jgi:hypothetical protein